MTETLIKEGTYFHNLLVDGLNNNVQKIIQIKTFVETVLRACSDFSQALGLSSRKFWKKIQSLDYNTEQTTTLLNKYMLETIGQINKKMNSISKKIQNEIVDPLQQFLASHVQINQNTLKKSQNMLSEIQANSSFLNQLTKNISVQTNNDFSMQQKIQLKKIYQQEMEKCNWKWHQIKKSYRNILQQLDSTNSSRIIFTNKIQIRFSKTLNKLLCSSELQNNISQCQDLSQQTQIFSNSIKEQIRQNLGRSHLLEQQCIQQYLKSGKLTNSQRDRIDDFIQIFTSRSNMKDDTHNYQDARMLILDDNTWAEYFLQKFQSNLHTQIHLSTIKYHQLTTIIKYIFASIIQLQKNEPLIYNILYISYRISNNSNYIIQQIGKYQDFWNDNQRWYHIIQHIRSLRNNFKEDSHIYSKKKFLINWWKHNKFDWRRITQKQIKSQKNINQIKDYEILCQINYYMARLQLKQNYIFNFLIQISKKYQINKNKVQKLFKYHYFNKKNNNNRLDSNTVRRKRIQEKYRNNDRITQKSMMCIGKVLKYLHLGGDMINLRLVCKKWSKYLKQKIYQRYLIDQKDNNLIAKYRLKLYVTISESAYSRELYNRMLRQLPQYSQHSDIINLDAKRSLSWDQSLRGLLIETLKVFAFYHPDVGYLQGMNYLCENILKITDDGFTVYRIFQHLMNHQFVGMYTFNFDSLRVKIYQFMRILQREKPKLYNHFQAETLQGQHFLLAWAITLWGEMSGDLCWVLWDGFLVKGWKWWIKTGIWLLGILQPQLLKMNFQELMKCFSDLNSTLLCCSFSQLQDFGITSANIKYQIDNIHIQNETLKQLQKQYQLKVSMVRDYMKKIKDY